MSITHGIALCFMEPLRCRNEIQYLSIIPLPWRNIVFYWTAIYRVCSIQLTTDAGTDVTWHYMIFGRKSLAKVLYTLWYGVHAVQKSPKGERLLPFVNIVGPSLYLQKLITTVEKRHTCEEIRQFCRNIRLSSIDRDEGKHSLAIPC